MNNGWNYADQDIIDEYLEAQYEARHHYDPEEDSYDHDEPDYDEYAEMEAADRMAWQSEDYHNNHP